MASTRFTKKPVTIDAMQWTGENRKELFDFCDKSYFNGDELRIQTLEGSMIASVGDYIIKGVKGEFYPCKPDIFAMTYDLAEKTEGVVAKSLHNTTANGARKNVRDIVFWGDGDTFRLISKASSEAEGWMKSTKAMAAGTNVVVQVTTQQRNPDGSYSVAEALTTVPNAIIAEYMENDVVSYRNIIERTAAHAGAEYVLYSDKKFETAE